MSLDDSVNTAKATSVCGKFRRVVSSSRYCCLKRISKQKQAEETSNKLPDDHPVEVKSEENTVEGVRIVNKSTLNKLHREKQIDCSGKNNL